MIKLAIFLLLVMALIAKMIYDVQKYKAQKLRTARLQLLAGIEIDEELAQELRRQQELSREKLKKKEKKIRERWKKNTLPLAQTAAEKVLADLGELERIEQRKANKEKV